MKAQSRLNAVDIHTERLAERAMETNRKQTEARYRRLGFAVQTWVESGNGPMLDAATLLAQDMAAYPSLPIDQGLDEENT